LEKEGAMALYCIVKVDHKQQTKANDCWYACTQMLLTWKNGVKTKPSGHHTSYLHAGPLGHTLHADFVASKHLAGVLTENGLKRLPTHKIDFGRPKSIYDALCMNGPIIVGGTFGEVLRHLIKGLGHYVVLAGIDEAGDRLWIHDPWHSKAHWMDRGHFAQLAWYDDDSQFVCN
jgi:hypothetical protein